MSKHSMGWAVAVVAAVFMAGLSLSGLTQQTRADQVLPGGHAAKIRSYRHVALGGTYENIIIPVVEGDHGMILTDFAVGATNTGRMYIDYSTDGINWDKGFAWTKTTSSPSCVSLESGIPIPSGAAVRVYCEGSGDNNVTISGYIW
jgi:hypothetical protein